MKKLLFFLLISGTLFAQKQRAFQFDADTTIRPDVGKYGLAAKSSTLYLVPRTGNMVKLLSETFPGSSYITILGTVATGVWNATLISVAKGGTGASDAAGARANLGLGTLATQSGTFSGTSSGTNTGDQTITLTGDVSGSGTGSFSVTIQNNAVTLAKMGTVATSTILGRVTAGTGNVEVLTAANVKTILGLGNVENTALSTWAGSTNITTLGTITNGVWSGTAIAVSKGGTGAADAATARSNLGLAIGSNVQAYDADLATIAGLTATTDNFMIANASAWASRTPAQARTSLGLGSLATLSTINNSNWSGTVLSTANGGTGSASGVGFLSGLTSGYIPKATGSTSLGNSIIQDNGTNVGIGTSSSGAKLHVNGSLYVGNSGNIDLAGDYVALNGAKDFRFTQNYGGAAAIQMVGNYPFHFITNNTIRATVKSTGQFRFVPLSSAPSSPEKGDVYMTDGTPGVLRVYTGSAWVDLH